MQALRESRIDDFASNISDGGPVDETTRTYRFVVTVEVEPEHPAYHDPEWAADAAHGALTNEYGMTAIYTDISESTD